LGRLLTLLGWKNLQVKNNLAYLSIASMTKKKSFKILTIGSKKSFYSNIFFGAKELELLA
jgi:hypothetical protein